MKKSDLIKALAVSGGLTQAQVNAVIDAQAALFRREVTTTGEITLPGIGIFKVKRRAARQGRNPGTGEVIAIAAKNAVAFKAEKAVRDALNA